MSEYIKGDLTGIQVENYRAMLAGGHVPPNGVIDESQRTIEPCPQCSKDMFVGPRLKEAAMATGAKIRCHVCVLTEQCEKMGAMAGDKLDIRITKGKV